MTRLICVKSTHASEKRTRAAFVIHVWCSNRTIRTRLYLLSHAKCHINDRKRVLSSSVSNLSRMDLSRVLLNWAGSCWPNTIILLNSPEPPHVLSNSGFLILFLGQPYNFQFTPANSVECEVSFAYLKGPHTMFQISIYAVSYTHLTLPTTPYV